MSTAHKMTFGFDELVIPIHGRSDSGMLIYGAAELVASCPDEPGEGFYVESIRLSDGATLVATGRGAYGFPCAFEKELFDRISKVIENDKTLIGRHAATEWADEIERLKEQGAPDRTDEAA